MHMQQNAISSAYIHLGHCFHRKAQHLQFVPLLQLNITTPGNDTLTHTHTHTHKKVKWPIHGLTSLFQALSLKIPHLQLQHS